MTSPSMTLKFIGMSDFVQEYGSEHNDVPRTSCWIISMVPKNQHLLGRLAGAVRETRLRRANDIEVLYLLGLKGFPFHPKTDW